MLNFGLIFTGGGVRSTSPFSSQQLTIDTKF